MQMWEILRFWELKTREVIEGKTGNAWKRFKSAINQFPVSGEGWNFPSQ